MRDKGRITAWVFLVFSWSSLSVTQAAGEELFLFGKHLFLKINASKFEEVLFSSAEVVIAEYVEFVWRRVRAAAVVPALRAAVAVCLGLSVMLLAETIYLNVVSIVVMVLRRKPERQYKWEPFQKDDPEAGSLAFPMVLVQIPMYNEKEVYKLSIGASCRLAWPTDRIIIQVLDDSTDSSIREMVEEECSLWAAQGHNINYELRDGRKGYKAGALQRGLARSYVSHCEYVAIFDADFQPEPDFLLRTVPFLVHNPLVALVQARWEFVNYKECMMTRIQRMSLDYHFKVEQEGGSSAHGTAGVWRVSALNDAGGWEDRTTVEDMDLAIRACLRGWRFIYLGDVKVKSELPSTFQSYRDQQHRWTSGGANLFRKMGLDIIKAKEVSLWKKVYLIYSFFFVRKIVSHFLTFVFYCLVIPLVAFFPEVEIPPWGLVYVPTVITLFNALRNPSSIHLMALWILFENVMAMHRMRAIIAGLLEMGRVNDWVVTKKFGDAADAMPKSDKHKACRFRFIDRIYWAELGLGIFLSLCACYNLAFSRNYHYVYMFMQSMAFSIVGLGYVGCAVPSSL
ncbi:putative glucomannan 4-beta-mannosyltransferase 11 isoform X2 [Wolffia australiana]